MLSIPEIRFRPVSLTGLNESEVLEAMAEAQRQAPKIHHYLVIAGLSCIDRVFKQVSQRVNNGKNVLT